MPRYTSRHEVVTDVIRPWAGSSGSSPSSESERGDTLIEVLMGLVVLSLTVVSLLLAFSTSISASAEHRNLAVSDTLLRSSSDSVFSTFQQNPVPFSTSCANATGANYTSRLNALSPSPLATPAPYTAYTATVDSVLFWNGTAFTASCTAGYPQQLIVKIVGPGGTYYQDVAVQGNVQVSGSSSTPVLTVTAADQNLAYSGGQVAPDTSSVAGFQGGDAATVASATYTYVGTGSTTYGPLNTPPTNTGTYSVTPSNAALSFTSGNAASYSTPYQYVPGTLTVGGSGPVGLGIVTAPAGSTGSPVIVCGTPSASYSCDVTGVGTGGHVVFYVTFVTAGGAQVVRSATVASTINEGGQSTGTVTIAAGDSSSNPNTLIASHAGNATKTSTLTYGSYSLVVHVSS